jgi:serine phosphatase RsbU (regulator of sigma subunit)
MAATSPSRSRASTTTERDPRTQGPRLRYAYAVSLRTRLIIAFLLLSVLPLTAVTLLSYRSSVTAFEQAAQQEASERAADVTRRMEMVTAELGRRMDRVFVTSDPQKMRESLAPMLGETAALVDRVEFHPEPLPAEEPALPPPSPPAPPRPGRTPLPPASGHPAPPPHPAPSVVVMDVQKIVEEAKKAARVETRTMDPKVAAMVEQSMSVGLASMEGVIAAVAEAVANNSAASAAAAKPPANQAVDGRRLERTVRRDGRLLGRANATLNMDRTLNAVLALSQRDQGELAFAIDRRGKLYTPRPADAARLEAIGVQAIAPRAADGEPQREGEWIVVARRDTGGTLFGVARPIGESLREIRRASVRNLALGFGVIALAVIGIVPISHRMTQHLTALTAGVRQLAGGDFGARVQVNSKDEFGTLAQSFNQMAADLQRQQSLVVEQERLKRELELSRQIQTEMLPRSALRSTMAEIAGVSVPAREVGGDFFNYFDLPDGRLALLVGDVSGKGVSAALLMANAQATLRARLPLEPDLAPLADAFDRELDRATPRAVYLTLFMGIIEGDGRMLRYVNAGHNPQFLIRRSGTIEPLASTGLPIALYAGHGYFEAQVAIEPGDLLFFYTDGLVEAENGAGDMFGAERLQGLLATVQASELDVILREVDAQVRSFRGAVEPLDDATMMALRVTAPGVRPPLA